LKPINYDRVQRAKSIIVNDGIRVYRVSNFTHALGLLHIKHQQEHKRILQYLNYISQDLTNIETILNRLDWEKQLWCKGDLNDGDWMAYASCDIILFHTEMRSIYDYIMELIFSLSKSPTQIPKDKRRSFETVKNWIEKNTDKWDEDLSKYILSADWFKDVRDVRDAIIHNGAFTLVFLVKDKITFQVHQNLMKRKILIPDIMYNKNIVDFELYAAMYMAYLYSYLEELGELILKKLNVVYNLNKPEITGADIGVVYDWFDKLTAHASAQSVVESGGSTTVSWFSESPRP
jgi:hypothetical protein